MKSGIFALAALAMTAGAAPVLAQDSSYVPGTVWETSSIKVEPGQFENYMDYLGTHWRKVQEVGKSEGFVVSYHVFALNDARKDEPDLILAIEYKDYATNAQRLAMQKKLEAVMAMDAHGLETASGQRVKMRTEMGGAEWQELKFK